MTTNEKRIHLNNDLLERAKNLWPKDKEVLARLINQQARFEAVPLKTELETKFVEDLNAFLLWATAKGEREGLILSTAFHDIGEFLENRNQSWFCPRSSGYKKTLMESICKEGLQIPKYFV